jgi:hypothetical protein
MTAQQIVANEGSGIVQTAQLLQKRRENWKKTLDAVPANKGKSVKFPYESLAEGVKDGFSKLTSGDEDEQDGNAVAFALLVKGYKTKMWRKLAEKNRELRDNLAEGVEPKKRVRKVKPAAEATS